MRFSSINTANRNIACPIRLPAPTEPRGPLIATIGVAHWPVQTPRPQNRSCLVVPSAFTMTCFRATSMGSSVCLNSFHSAATSLMRGNATLCRMTIQWPEDVDLSRMPGRQDTDLGLAITDLRQSTTRRVFKVPSRVKDAPLPSTSGIAHHLPWVVTAIATIRNCI